MTVSETDTMYRMYQDVSVRIGTYLCVSIMYRYWCVRMIDTHSDTFAIRT